jgi:hypothetical protein
MRFFIAMVSLVVALVACTGEVQPPLDGLDLGEGEGDGGEEGEGEGDGPPEGEGEGDGPPPVGEGEGDGPPPVGEGEGEGDGPPPVGEGEGEGDGPPPPVYNPVPDAAQMYLASAALAANVDFVTAAMVNTVVQGGVTTGTVNFDTGMVTNTPTDALVAVQGTETVRYVIADVVVGDVELRSIPRWMASDHSFIYTAEMANQFNINVSDVHRAGVITVTASGTLVPAGGTTRTFTLNTTGTSTFVLGMGNSDYTNEETTSGTVTGDVALTFNQTERYRSVFFQNFVENRVTATNATATIGTHTLSMMNAIVSRSFTNVLASEPDFWNQTAGSVTVDGAANAITLAAINDATSFSVVLQRNGMNTVLEQYAR